MQLNIKSLSFEEKLDLLGQLCYDSTFPIFYRDSDEGYCPANSPAHTEIEVRRGKEYVKIECVII